MPLQFTPGCLFVLNFIPPGSYRAVTEKKQGSTKVPYNFLAGLLAGLQCYDGDVHSVTEL